MLPNLTLGCLAFFCFKVLGAKLEILIDLCPIVSDVKLSSKHVMSAQDPMVIY